jgi:hypothetical protein
LLYLVQGKQPARDLTTTQVKRAELQGLCRIEKRRLKQKFFNLGVLHAGADHIGVYFAAHLVEITFARVQKTNPT